MKKLLILALVLSIAIVSCGYYGGGPSDRYQAVDYAHGTQGIVFRFLPGAPPQEVYEGNPMSISIEYSNKGLFNVVDPNAGFFYLGGFDQTFFPGLRQYTIHPGKPFTAEGVSEFNPYGDIFSVAEITTDVFLQQDVPYLDQPIKATACYPYKTIATPKVCIDSDYNDLVKDKVCRTRDVSLSGGQGAPVAITHLEQETIGERVQFKIYFQNQGRGEVFHKNPLGGIPGVENCHTQLDRDDIGRIELEEVSYSGLPNLKPTCKPEVIRLNQNGQGFIYCVCQGAQCVTAGETYETVLKVVLNYGYRDSAMTYVRILKNPDDFYS